MIVRLAAPKGESKRSVLEQINMGGMDSIPLLLGAVTRQESKKAYEIVISEYFCSVHGRGKLDAEGLMSTQQRFFLFAL